ncbi:hypothetical protein OG285_17240 [Streptomyces sp. NBC_01471]
MPLLEPDRDGLGQHRDGATTAEGNDERVGQSPHVLGTDGRLVDPHTHAQRVLACRPLVQ